MQTIIHYIILIFWAVITYWKELQQWCDTLYVYLYVLKEVIFSGRRGILL